MAELIKNKAYNKVYGNIGERLASEYLENCGYKVIEKNYKTFLGEIDIICVDNKNKTNPTYVFAEVKYRNSTKFGLPREAVTKTKQQTIKKVAIFFLKQKKLFEKVSMRFDCVEIVDGEKGQSPQISLIENAF